MRSEGKTTIFGEISSEEGKRETFGALLGEAKREHVPF